MRQQFTHLRSIRKYLLGIATPREKKEIEEKLMTKDAFLDVFQVAEVELVSDYVRCVLSPMERAQFERHYLKCPDGSPNKPHVANLHFAKAIHQYILEANSKKIA